MKKHIIIQILFFFLISSPIFACQPCLGTPLNLEETVDRADLIIVGHKIDDGQQSSSREDIDILIPELIQVRILEILKGSTQSTEIKVRSFYGMCAYGIVLNDNRNYLILLSNVSETEEELYSSVDGDCAEKSYLVLNNQVDIKGQNISLDDFASKHSLIRTTLDDRTQTKDTTNNQNNFPTDTSNDIVQDQGSYLNDREEESNSFSQYYFIILTSISFLTILYVFLKIRRKK